MQVNSEVIYVHSGHTTNTNPPANTDNTAHSPTERQGKADSNSSCNFMEPTTLYFSWLVSGWTSVTSCASPGEINFIIKNYPFQNSSTFKTLSNTTY